MDLKFCLGVSLYATFLLALVGCSDDIVQKETPVTGNGIVFGANANYAGGPETRTEYGEISADGKSQAINWIENDQVVIYSPTSPTVKEMQYGITNIQQDAKNKAYLKSSGADGLQWDRTNSVSTQDFYAVYPAPESIENQDVKNRVKFESGVLTGYIPVNQEHEITKDGKVWTAKPEMDYLYMAAVNEAFPIPTEESENDGVSLDFVPLTTTLEITLHGPSSELVSLNIRANDGENIAGAFTCDLTDKTKRTDGYPDCEYQSSSTVRDMITITTYENTTGKYKPLKLASGESITFNVFLLPHQALDNISIRVVGLNTTGVEASLNEKNIVLNPHKKTRVIFNAPELSGSDPNTWITTLDDNILISQLSIPGTANSYSYNYSDSHPEMYKTQTENIDRQWNAGIRCFELKCPNSSENTLENVQLQCNGQNLGITFGDAVDYLWGKVNGTGEFAMIIPFFESQLGRGSNVRDFAEDLNQFFEDHTEYKYTTYGNQVTVGEAQGSLMFVARITSEEDENITLPIPVQGVFVHHWGSLKDNWARRGYVMNGIKVQNWATNETYNNPWSTPTVEYYMMNGNTSERFVPREFPQKDESQIDFIHETTRSTGNTGRAYIQDWSRVIPENYNFYMERNSSRNNSRYCYWHESYSEKFDDVWRTFELSIEDNSHPDSSTPFYINSLDGYFADWTDTGDDGNSAYPYVEGGTGWSSFMSGGGRGDIENYAEKINNEFYNAILKYGTDRIYGPMNVVLLDRVYVGDGGTYLPSVIINNNFRFPLLTKDGSSTQNE